MLLFYLNHSFEDTYLHITLLIKQDTDSVQRMYFVHITINMKKMRETCLYHVICFCYDDTLQPIPGNNSELVSLSRALCRLLHF